MRSQGRGEWHDERTGCPFSVCLLSLGQGAISRRRVKERERPRAVPSFENTEEPPSRPPPWRRARAPEPSPPEMRRVPLPGLGFGAQYSTVWLRWAAPWHRPWSARAKDGTATPHRCQSLRNQSIHLHGLSPTGCPQDVLRCGQRGPAGLG